MTHSFVRYLSGIVEAGSFNDHVDYGGETAPGSDVQRCPPSLLPLLDVGPGRKEELADVRVAHLGRYVDGRLQPLRNKEGRVRADVLASEI